MISASSSHKLLCPRCGSVYEADEHDRCPDDGSMLTEVVLDGEPDEDPLVGEIVDERFEIEDVLGEGAMGRVYRATQTSVHRTIALKTVRPNLATDETIVRRFHREAQAISGFSHPNIVRLVDFGQDLQLGTLYLAMEYVDGYPLDELMDRGRLEPGLAIQVAIQLCGALAEVHSHEFVHRDLKPSNLVLVPLADGRLEIKLLDFGIAHILQDRKNLTESGAVFGTPHYLSPEQAQSTKVGPYSDVYSVGAVLFEMLAGRPPIVGETSMEVIVGHVRGRAPALQEVVESGEVPRRLAALVDSMLEVEPEKRPDNIVEVRDELKAIVSEQGYESPEVDPSLEREEMFEPFVRETGIEGIPSPEDLFESGEAGDSAGGGAVHKHVPTPEESGAGGAASSGERPAEDSAEEGVAAGGEAKTSAGRTGEVPSEEDAASIGRTYPRTVAYGAVGLVLVGLIVGLNLWIGPDSSDGASGEPAGTAAAATSGGAGESVAVSEEAVPGPSGTNEGVADAGGDGGLDTGSADVAQRRVETGTDARRQVAERSPREGGGSQTEKPGGRPGETEPEQVDERAAGSGTGAGPDESEAGARPSGLESSGNTTGASRTGEESVQGTDEPGAGVGSDSRRPSGEEGAEEESGAAKVDEKNEKEKNKEVKRLEEEKTTGEASGTDDGGASSSAAESEASESSESTKEEGETDEDEVPDPGLFPVE